MSRTFTEFSADHNIRDLLNLLVNPDTDVSSYTDAMHELGVYFGKQLSPRISTKDSVTIACTVEDADSLAKGIVTELLANKFKVSLVVFWNKRIKNVSESGVSVAPILKEYHEKGYKDSQTLIIVKSIISSSCVVRTNLTKIINESHPKEIFVVAPVILKGATQKLENEFEESVYRKFQYVFFAEDSEKDSAGMVTPGIGGDVYQRLGFSGQDAKNKFVPGIVRERRRSFQ